MDSGHVQASACVEVEGMDPRQGEWASTFVEMKSKLSEYTIVTSTYDEIEMITMTRRVLVRKIKD